MIARTHRFHGHGSLRFVYQHGSTVRDSLCALKYLSNPKRHNYRLAVVVSKKTAKSAVVRNRIRRRLFEQFRQRVPANQNYDMVVTVYSDRLATMPAEELDRIVGKLLDQAHIAQKTVS